NGVDYAACGASVFSRIARCVDLKLADGCLADRVADARTTTLFGEEGLVVIAAVNCVVVQQAGDAAEADQAEGAIGHCAGSEQCEIGPTAAVDGQLVNRSLVDVARKVLLRGVDYRRLSINVHRTGHW